MGQYHSLLPTMKVLILSSCLIAATLSKPQGYSEPAYPDEPAKYQYTYGVQDDYTANNFGQQESRDGYSAQGEYFVNLPDGRLQKMTYTVNGDGGYVADVSYTGEAQYPLSLPADTDGSRNFLQGHITKRKEHLT